MCGTTLMLAWCVPPSRRRGSRYGRMDYGLLGDRIQVYEINTNPTLFLPGNPRLAPRLSRKIKVARNLYRTLVELCEPP